MSIQMYLVIPWSDRFRLRFTVEHQAYMCCDTAFQKVKEFEALEEQLSGFASAILGMQENEDRCRRHETMNSHDLHAKQLIKALSE